MFIAVLGSLFFLYKNRSTYLRISAPALGCNVLQGKPSTSKINNNVAKEDIVSSVIGATVSSSITNSKTQGSIISSAIENTTSEETLNAASNLIKTLKKRK